MPPERAARGARHTAEQEGCMDETLKEAVLEERGEWESPAEVRP